MLSEGSVLDDLRVNHRPLVAYVVTSAMACSGLLWTRYLGFHRRFRRGVDRGISVDIQHRRGVWHAAAKGGSRRAGGMPIVFVHGIGVGFVHYAKLLQSLPRDRDVYLVEWPHVTMSIVGGAAAPASVDDTTATIKQVLHGDGHAGTGACFVGHSLGTTCVAWLLHDPRTRHLVASTVLLGEPACTQVTH